MAVTQWSWEFSTIQHCTLKNIFSNFQSRIYSVTNIRVYHHVYFNKIFTENEELDILKIFLLQKTPKTHI